MKPKPYVLMLAKSDPRANISASQLKEVKRILGDDAWPLMASKGAAAMLFIGSDMAKSVADKVKSVVGDQTQILVMELGRDKALWGFPEHLKYLDRLEWYRSGESAAGGKN